MNVHFYINLVKVYTVSLLKIRELLFFWTAEVENWPCLYSIKVRPNLNAVGLARRELARVVSRPISS
jgi:hypothetical protein